MLIWFLNDRLYYFLILFLTLYYGKIVFWTNCVHFMDFIGLGPWKWTYVLYFSFVCVYYLIDCFHIKDLIPRIIIYFQDLLMLSLSSNILLGLWNLSWSSRKHLWFPGLLLIPMEDVEFGLDSRSMSVASGGVYGSMKTKPHPRLLRTETGWVLK